MKENRKAGRIFNSVIIFGYSLIVGLLLLINIIFGSREYLFKKDFLIPNILILLIGIIIIVAGYFFHRIIRVNINKYTIYILSGLLFILQCFVFYNILFITHTWDAWTVMNDARNYIDNNLTAVNINYYSQFPNNIWIFAIVSAIVKISSFIGITGLENQLFVTVIIQSALSSLTGLLVYKIVDGETKSKGYALFAWLVYVILVGLSAQTIIPYTDMMSLIFPVLVYRIYQTLDTGKRTYVKWFLIVLLSFIGYKIKPTAIIILIGIGVCEIVDRLINIKKQNIIDILKIISASLIAIVLGLLINKCVILIVDIPQNKELNTGPLHMLMMGTNDETNGSFSIWDVAASLGEPDKEQRTAMQMETIKNRVTERGFGGNVKFYVKKALMIFNDGTFAIGDEGGYYDEVFSDKIPVVSEGLKSWYYSYGKGFKISSLIQQIIWIMLMLLNTLSVVINKEKNKAVIALSLIGIIIFNLLFEARARYLLIYVPLFIVMAFNAMESIYRRIDTKKP